MQGAADGLQALHGYLQEKGLEKTIESELKDLQPFLARSLIARADIGILVFVSIYRGPEGQKRFDAVLVLGEGATPAAAFRRSKALGGIRSLPPQGMLPDEVSSFMIWYRAERGLIVGESIPFPFWKTIARGEDLDSTGKKPSAQPQLRRWTPW
jgi:hypothetical protein